MGPNRAGGLRADRPGRMHGDRAGARAAADGPGRVRGLRGNRVPNFLVALAPGLSSSILTAQNCVKNVYSSNPVYDYSTHS